MIPTSAFASGNYASQSDILDDFNQVEFIAEEKNPVSFDAPSSLERFGEISYSDKVSINDDEMQLYPTFDSPEEALSKVIDTQSQLISQLKAKYELPEFSDDTWEMYYNALDKYNESIEDEIVQQGEEDTTYQDEIDPLGMSIAHLYEFFDIYENNSDNDDIINEFKNASKVSLEEKFSENQLEQVDGMHYIKSIQKLAIK